MVIALKRFIATGMYSGLLRPAPGTWGSLAACFLLIPILNFDLFEHYFPITILTLLFCGLNFWSAEVAIQQWGNDPGQMVIDEWAGLSLAFALCYEWTDLVLHVEMVWISSEVITFISIFVLFRIFDIIKPLGISKLQQINGALGILLDDLAAGAFTAITMNVLSRLI